MVTGPVHAECRIDINNNVWILEIASRTIGGECGQTLNTNNELVEVIAQIFSSYKQFDSNIRNDFYDQIFTDVLENNPQLSAIWVSWELSAIDNNWNYPYGRKRITAFVNSGNTNLMLKILYQDDYLVTINKPSGLLVHRSMIDRHETEFAIQQTRDQIGQFVYQ